MNDLKLYMLLLGCKPPGRHTEQHDVFFGIGASLADLVPQIKAFWPEPERIHIDAWREVTSVDGYRVRVSEKDDSTKAASSEKLFFINLGGYQENQFAEQHYILLTVQPDSSAAARTAKASFFFRNNHFADAKSHIDDKYGVDVDDIYQIEEILSEDLKANYSIELTRSEKLPADPTHLGYLKLSSLG